MASLWTLASGGTTMVASNSSMISGPDRGVAVDGRAIDDIDRACRLAARKGYRAACLRPRAPARGEIFMAPKIEPVVAQAAPGHAHLHQLDRGIVPVAVGLEIFGDEALADLREILAFEGHGELGRLALVAQIGLPQERGALGMIAVAGELGGDLRLQVRP